MKELVTIAEKIAAQLIARKQTIAVAESSTGGLISAALLAVPGASGYFLGGGVIYTRDARHPLGVGALRTIAGEPDPATLLHRLGPLGDRRHRTCRQPLRRRCRP